MLDTETDVFVDEVVDSETATPVGTTGAVKAAGGEGINLKFLITEFAIRSGSHGFFEGLRRGAREGASDGDNNCDECDCEFFHDVVFLFLVTLISQSDSGCIVIFGTRVNPNLCFFSQ